MSEPTETQLQDARREVTGPWNDSTKLAYMTDPAFHASTHRLIMAVARIAAMEDRIAELEAENERLRESR